MARTSTFTVITRYNASGIADTIEHCPTRRARLESILDRIAGFEGYDDDLARITLAEIDAHPSDTIESVEDAFAETLAEKFQHTGGKIEMFEADSKGSEGYYYG